MEYVQPLRVYMLGGFEIYYEGVPVQLKKKQTAKPVELLQLLLYHCEEGVSRHKIVETLFGQDTEIDAANNLNAAVSQLRKLLRDTHLPNENYIKVRFDRYFFESLFPVWVDAREAVNLRQIADIKSGEERVKALYELCDLYHGRFLPELDGEDWVEIARAGHLRIYRESLNEVCRVLKANHDYNEILRLTGVAAKLFPFDEWQVWQQKCLLAQGKIHDARELYRQVEKLYMAELDAPPPEGMSACFEETENSGWRRTDTALCVQKWLQTSKIEGPCCIPLPSFLDMYNLVSHISEVSKTPFCLLLCTLESKQNRSDTDFKEFNSAMEKLEDAIADTLRLEDVFTHYSRSQFLVMLIGARKENFGVISERIANRFSELVKAEKYILNCQMLPIDKIPVLAK